MGQYLLQKRSIGVQRSGQSGTIPWVFAKAVGVSICHPYRHGNWFSAPMAHPLPLFEEDPGNQGVKFYAEIGSQERSAPRSSPPKFIKPSWCIASAHGPGLPAPHASNIGAAWVRRRANGRDHEAGAVAMTPTDIPSSCTKN